MSATSSNISQAYSALAATYHVPLEFMDDPEFAQALQTVDNFARDDIPQIPNAIETFQQDALQILEKELSDEKMRELQAGSKAKVQSNIVPEQVKQEKGGIKSRTRKLVSRNVFLKDAKHLFKEHVVSICKDTKRDLMHGSTLSKIGATLAFPGRVWTGVSKFWGGLIEKRPLLCALDVVVIIPLAVSLYANVLPCLAAVKSCELVGRAMCAYSKAPKGSKWKAIKKAASEFATSTLWHAQRVMGGSLEPTILATTGAAAVLDQEQQRNLMPVLKDILKEDKTKNVSLESILIELVIASVASVPQMRGVAGQEVIKIARDMLSNKEQNINIGNLCESSENHISTLIQRVYSDVSKEGLSGIKQNFQTVINNIQESTQITSKEKEEVVAAITKQVTQSVVLGVKEVANEVQGRWQAAVGKKEEKSVMRESVAVDGEAKGGGKEERNETKVVQDRSARGNAVEKIHAERLAKIQSVSQERQPPV